MGPISYPTSDLELETWVEQTIQNEIAGGRLLQDQKSLASQGSKNNPIIIGTPKLANSGVRRATPKWNKRGVRNKSPLAKNNRMSSSTSQDDSSSTYKSPRLGRPACSMRISELAVPSKRQCIEAWRANANILPDTMINRLKMRVTDQEPIVKVSDTINCSKAHRRATGSQSNVIVTPSKRASRKINKEAMNNRINAENKAISDTFGIKIAELLMKPMVVTLNPELKNVSNVISEEIYDIIKNTKLYKTDQENSQRMVREISEKVTIWIAKILEDSSDKLLEEDLRARTKIPTEDLITLIEMITCQERDLEEEEGPVLDILEEIVNTILHTCVRTPSGVLTPEFQSATSEDVEKDDQQDADSQNPDEETSIDETITLDKVTKEDTVETDIAKQLNLIIDSLTQDSSERPTSQTKLTESDDLELAVDIEVKHEERDTKTESDSKSELDIRPELHDQLELDIRPELQDQLELDIQPDPDIKSELDKNLEPDVDVLYSNDTPLANPEDDNDYENFKNNSELNLIQLPSADERTDLAMIKSEKKGDENMEDDIFLPSEENNLTNSNDEQTSKVSGAIEIIPEELSEERNKKVQFSKENLEPINEKEGNNQFHRPILHLEDEQLLENITDFERPHIEFAPPNEDLLSDADESWPVTTPLTKPSASVTRSITSMGKLLESDEIYSNVFEDHKEVSPETIMVERREDIDVVVKEQFSTLHTEEGPETVQENINIELRETGDIQYNSNDIRNIQEIDETVLHATLIEHEIENKNEKSLEELTQYASVTSLQIEASVILLGDENVHDFKELDVSKRERSKSDQHVEGDTTSGQIYVRLSAEDFHTHTFDYRVHSKTAPDWIRRGQGEPNVNPCACRLFDCSGHYRNYSAGIDQLEEREMEIRKWCQDLDFVLMNLDKWRNWLNYISEYITDLKRIAGKMNGSRKIRAPPDIDEDSKLRHLNKSPNGGGLEIRRRNDTVRLKIAPPPVKYCASCGRRKSNQTKKRYHQNYSRNITESKCRRHCIREQRS